MKEVHTGVYIYILRYQCATSCEGGSLQLKTPCARTAFDVIQQLQATQQATLQQLQSMQGGSAAPPPPPPPPPPDVPAGSPAVEVDESAWWYQGPRTCRRCGQKAYLRQGICYNMECVPR